MGICEKLICHSCEEGKCTNMTDLIRHGLGRDYEAGHSSDASNMLYQHVKKSPEEISKMIRETWEYIEKNNVSSRILSHFLYLLAIEVERDWVKDISLDIVKYGLVYNDDEVTDRAIGLVEAWNDRDILELLYSIEIKEGWLNEYKNSVLKHYNIQRPR